MKFLNEICEDYMGLDKPEEGQLIYSVIGNKHEYFLKPYKKAEEISCMDCNGTEGFIFNKNTWICWQCTNQRITTKPISVEKKLSIQSFGVEDEYQDCDLQTCEQPLERKVFLRKFAEKPDQYIIFAGDNGIGKTYTACATMQEYVKIGKNNCRFTKAANLYIEWLKNKSDGIGDHNFIYKYAEYELLIIDDLGGRIPTEAFLDVFYLLIDSRKSKGLGTIITTNLTSGQIREKFGDAIFSRIVSGKIFKFEGEDRRLKRVSF